MTHQQIVLYSIFKHAGIEKKECIALLSVLGEKDQDVLIDKIVNLMDYNDWQLPTEQQLMDILFPILKAKKDY